jgi:hypothetical protein
MTAGNTYRIEFYQAVQSSTYAEKLQVTVGNAQTAASQTTVLYTNSSLTNTTYAQRVTSEYTAPSTGTFYFGFNCFSVANMYYLYVDNVKIIETTVNSIPYTYGFETSQTDQVSMTWAQSSVSGADTWMANSSLSTYNRTPRTGSFDAYLKYSNEDWFFIPVSLTSGTQYSFSIYARQDGSTTTDANMVVSYGTTATSGGMTTSIVASTGLNATYQNITGTFTPGSTGTFYVGIKGYMNATPWYISIDDISITTTSSAPTITTTAISAITTTTATSGGNITSIGSAAVTTSGICWSTSTNPTTSSSKTTDGATSAASFASNLSSLSAETYYYVRAYATNSVGTSYGANVAFYTYSTEPTGHSATFTAVASAVSSQIDLTFTAASTYGADGYIILRLAGATAPNNTNINDGTAPGSLSMSGSTVLVTTITSNATTTYSNTGLAPNTQYSYAIIPYNWDATNAGTYNYRTSATIPTCNATTPDVPSSEGLAIAGAFVNNGTFDQSGDVNYYTMTGTSKSITGTGVYTSAKMNVNGTITFDGTISSGSFTKTYVTTAKTFTVNTNKTYVNGTFTNIGTTTLNSGSTFKNSGDWTNNGTVTAVATSTGEFNGSSAQIINGSVSTTFSNLKINNSSTGVSMGIHTLVNNTLTLTAGLLKTVSYTLTVGTDGANGSISGGSSTTYISAYDNAGTIGNVKQFVNSNAAFSYPIGDATKYTPLTFTLTANGGLSSAYLTVYTKNVKVPGLNAGITAYLDRYWDVTESGFTTPTYSMSYTYVDADLVGSETGMLPIKKSGSTWYKPTGSSFTDGTVQGTGSFNAGTNTLTWTGLSTFSGFGGVPNGVEMLPITLLSFSGKKVGRENELNWVTSSEINNDFFTIEKTIDGNTFEIVGNENGAGNSTELLTYSLKDYNVQPVVNYYRLKQTDYDGKSTVSELISIDNSALNSSKEIVQKTNILGQEVNESYRGLVVVVYSDGTSIKIIQ